MRGLLSPRESLRGTGLWFNLEECGKKPAVVMNEQMFTNRPNVGISNVIVNIGDHFSKSELADALNVLKHGETGTEP